MKRGDIEVGAEPVDILFSVQLENSPRMGKRVKCFRVQAAILEDRIDFPTNKTIRENTCIPHTICGEKNSALFGHTNGLRQGFQLILRCKKMLHRAEQQRNLICIALKRGQVQSIALCNGDGFPPQRYFSERVRYCVPAIRPHRPDSLIVPRRDYTGLLLRRFPGCAHWAEGRFLYTSSWKQICQGGFTLKTPEITILRQEPQQYATFSIASYILHAKIFTIFC